MPRSLTSHKVNGCNEAIEIIPFGESENAGGLPTRYEVRGPKKNFGGGAGMQASFGENLTFHNGPVADGVNGITNEVLLAILEDRLVCAQAGKFACEENAAAVAAVQFAQAILKSRTEKRLARGVEGTHKV